MPDVIYEQYVPLDDVFWSDLTQQIVSEFKISRNFVVKAIRGTEFDPDDI